MQRRKGRTQEEHKILVQIDETCFNSRLDSDSGLTQNITKVGVIHELPLRKNKVFIHILHEL